MTFTATTRDDTLLPKILNLARRFACRTERVAMQSGDGRIAFFLEFDGPDLALRRLDAHLHKLLAAEEELFS